MHRHRVRFAVVVKDVHQIPLLAISMIRTIQQFISGNYETSLTVVREHYVMARRYATVAVLVKVSTIDQNYAVLVLE